MGINAKCRKCGAASAFVSITGECLDCKPLPNGTLYPPLGNALPNAPPTLRDMWAMAMYADVQRRKIGYLEITEECYRAAGIAMKVRGK